MKNDIEKVYLEIIIPFELMVDLGKGKDQPNELKGIIFQDYTFSFTYFLP